MSEKFETIQQVKDLIEENEWFEVIKKPDENPTFVYHGFAISHADAELFIRVLISKLYAGEYP